jgi:hypothetical protein
MQSLVIKQAEYHVLCDGTETLKNGVLKEKSAPVPLCPPQFPHGLLWD